MQDKGDGQDRQKRQDRQDRQDRQRTHPGLKPFNKPNIILVN